MAAALNPVLCGFYPDPSVCRAGEDFYLVNSSFSYFPGVPIFHSRDLAHWEQVGNILDREEQLPLMGGEISEGIFAPTIRYHDGTFYMVTTNMTQGGNFIVTAQSPDGPWSDPYYLGEEAKGIDPSLFFDTDGKCYYVGTRPNSQGMRYNGDWEIWVQELNLDEMKLVGQSWVIWKEALHGAAWSEGPHLYKIDGYYYLIYAEGGTGPEHSICAARSGDLFQMFEGCPRNPVFTHRDLGLCYPVVYAGHGDLVDDGKGNWYIIMLASRRCRQHSSMGRESFLAEVTWENGWPVINAGTGRLCDSVELPLEECRFADEIGRHDHLHFYGEELDKRLLGIQTRNEEQYSLKARKGFLRLYTREERITDKVNASYLGIRQKDYCFEVSAGIEFTPREQESAGLVYYQNHENHLRMEITEQKGRKVFCVTAHIHGEDQTISEIPVNRDGLAEIILRAREQTAAVWVKTGGQKALAAENINLLPYTTEEAGGFVGCTIGMYTSANGKNNGNYADFAWLSYDTVQA
nr:glycoside hydrolase family 43 protein [uncultured Schaedlerella sp.]